MKKEQITKLFSSFNKMNVLIIGDVMIDSYCIGRVERISPEAPVPVVAVSKKENRLGGAANVALNIQAMGATALLCSITGQDKSAETFKELMKRQGLRTDGLIPSTERMTTVKTRVIGGKHQMLRIDEETDDAASSAETKKLFERITTILNKEKVDIIIFEDYDKGVITASLIENVVRLAGKKNIPIAVDPKKKNFSLYTHVTLFKPNLKEFINGMKIDFEDNDYSALAGVTKSFQKKQEIDIALITLSEAGILCSTKSGNKIIPAHVRSISDVSGAGDTVISVAALCLAAKVEPFVMAAIANLAGGLVCEKSGVVPIDKKQLLEESIASLA